MSLILTRRANEAIHIGKDVIVKLLDIKGGQARIAIDAPIEVNIVRDELLERQADDDYAVRVK